MNAVFIIFIIALFATALWAAFLVATEGRRFPVEAYATTLSLGVVALACATVLATSDDSSAATTGIYTQPAIASIVVQSSPAEKGGYTQRGGQAGIVISGHDDTYRIADAIESVAQRAERYLASAGATTTRIDPQRVRFADAGDTFVSAAAGRDLVVVYAVTHGAIVNGSKVALCYACDRGEFVRAGDLVEWMRIAKRNGTEQFIVIVDACYSGVLLSALSQEARVITSSGTEKAWYQDGRSLFSDPFLGCLEQGGETKACFGAGKKSTEAFNQYPEISW